MAVCFGPKKTLRAPRCQAINSKRQQCCIRGKWKGPFQIGPLRRVEIRPSRWAELRIMSPLVAET